MTLGLINRACRALIYCCLIVFATSSHGHEGHGFTHMTASSGPIISSRNCPGGTLLWSHDDNLDGAVDRCTLVVFAHDKIHTKPIDMISGTCECLK